MKLNGQIISEVNRDVLVIPRESGDIVLHFAAVVDNEEFQKICPEPKPPTITRTGKAPAPDFEDKDYIKALTERTNNYSYWLILTSLQATPNLEWDLIKMNDPSTWKLLDEELKKAGFSQFERAKITNKAMEVNALSDEKLENAKKRFFERNKPVQKNT